MAEGVSPSLPPRDTVERALNVTHDGNIVRVWFLAAFEDVQ
jgi:hypothetical protein